MEEYILRNINRYFSLLLLGAALAVPAATMAGPKPQEASVQVRVYDRDHRDYHNSLRMVFSVSVLDEC
jgi:hypothetical protein